tara:strand:- start:274 stop:753 length:480 start_codon:yes stop_codon:yes gene_type:complete
MRLRLGVLRRANLLQNGRAKSIFCVSRSGRPSAALLETLRVLSMPDREFYEMLFFLRTNTPPMPGPPSPRQEAFVEIVLKWLARERLEPLIGEYEPSTSAATRPKGAGGAHSEHRGALAIAVVRGEAECLEALRRWAGRPFPPLEPQVVHRTWRGFWAP